MTWRVGADIGGTFTDITFLVNNETIHVMKCPSTPDDYSRGIVDGLLALLAIGYLMREAIIDNRRQSEAITMHSESIRGCVSPNHEHSPARWRRPGARWAFGPKRKPRCNRK
jgi:hypothetical protein